MDKIKWYFPETLEKAFEIYSDESDAFIHGGGLSLTKRNIKEGSFIDLSKTPLKYVKDGDEEIVLGATTTIGDILRFEEENSMIGVLKNAFSKAASTLLRNRMTIGGSVFEFPWWSDIVPLLISLDAKVKIYDGEEKIFELDKYYEIKKDLGKHIIKEIIIPKKKNMWYIGQRLAKTEFDDLSLVISVILTEKDGIIENIKGIVGGVKGRYAYLDELNSVVGKKIDDIDVDSLIKKEFSFIEDGKFTNEYKNKMLRVYLSDAFKEISESLREEK